MSVVDVKGNRAGNLGVDEGASGANMAKCGELIGLLIVLRFTQDASTTPDFLLHNFFSFTFVSRIFAG